MPTTRLIASVDTWTYDNGSTGPTDVKLIVGNAVDGGFNTIRFESWINWDLSSIPTGSTVTDAFMDLYGVLENGLDNAQGGSNSVLLTSVDAPWTEAMTAGAEPARGSAGALAGTSAATSGADDMRLVTNTTVAGKLYRFSNLTAIVDQWVKGTRAKNGLVLYNPTGGSSGYAYLGSRENATPEYRPALTVTFTPPPLLGRKVRGGRVLGRLGRSVR